VQQQKRGCCKSKKKTDGMREEEEVHLGFVPRLDMGRWFNQRSRFNLGGGSI